MPVAAFLSGYDFSGKTIVPFCTHEGSRLGRTVTDITLALPAVNHSGWSCSAKDRGTAEGD
jgi:hypothetical protein